MQAQGTRNAFLINLLALENRIQQVEVETKNKIFKLLNQKIKPNTGRYFYFFNYLTTFSSSTEAIVLFSDYCQVSGWFCRLGISVMQTISMILNQVKQMSRKVSATLFKEHITSKRTQKRAKGKGMQSRKGF